MSSLKKRKIRLEFRKEECTASNRPRGLARTRKIISTEKAREVQFMKLCAQIQLDEKKENRANEQLNERRAKRRTT